MPKAKPRLYSYWITYTCGCQHHVHRTPVYDPTPNEPCFLCASGPKVPEWVELGKLLRQKRKAAGLTWGDITGIDEDDVMLMETGRKDPAPLKAFWEQKEPTHD